jgi:hypothetical protein
MKQRGSKRASSCHQTRSALSLLGKGTRIVAKEFEKSVGVSFHVELHLPLFQNLQRGRIIEWAFVARRRVDDGSRTSNLASVIRCSISKRWSTACGLMMATVRVALTRGEVGVVGVDELWRASSWLAEMPRSLWSDMV